VHPIRVDGDRVRIVIGFHICNNEPGIAECLFASVLPLSVGGPKCNFGFSETHEGFRFFKSLNCFSIIGNIDIRLPPGAWLEVARMMLDLIPPFIQGLKIEGTFGCSNVPPLKFIFENSAQNINSWHGCIFHQYDDTKRTEIVNELFGIQTPE
jgi:hypothetical protein